MLGVSIGFHICNHPFVLGLNQVVTVSFDVHSNVHQNSLVLSALSPRNVSCKVARSHDVVVVREFNLFVEILFFKFVRMVLEVSYLKVVFEMLKGIHFWSVSNQFIQWLVADS